MAIAEITGALAGVKSAMEIAKALLAAEKAIEVAALKMQVAQLMSSLADVQTKVIDANEAIEARDKEIGALRNALEFKAKVVKRLDAYHESDENGNPKGDPFCMRCFEADHRLFHVTLGGRLDDAVICPQCKARYDGSRVSRLHGT